jgi:short-subunit dehydrogenase
MPRPSTTAIRSAFVLGSTSAVAQAICRELARRGCRRFHLVARNGAANTTMAVELRDHHGAEVSTDTIDLVDSEGSIPATQAIVKSPRIPESFDLYLIAAGSLGDPERARSDAAEALAITAANYTGLLPWLTAITSPERIRQPGRLWVFASVAADRGRPSNHVYGAAKAALTTFCEGLMLSCHGQPFAIRILKAGFMATPMTIGKAPPALCASPESVARDLLRRPDRRGIEYIPWFWGPIMALVRFLPPAMARKL